MIMSLACFLYSPGHRELGFSETGLPVFGVLGNSKHVWLRFCKTFVIKGVRLFPRSEGGASIRSVGGRLRGGSNGTSKRGQDGADAK